MLCFTRPIYQVSVYRTIGPLVSFSMDCFETLQISLHRFRFQIHQVSNTNNFSLTFGIAQNKRVLLNQFVVDFISNFINTETQYNKHRL